MTDVERSVETTAGTILYTLQHKKVKNINLRILKDGTVSVSAHPRVPQKAIDDFLRSKADWIQKGQIRCKERLEPSLAKCTEEEIKKEILALCKTVYPYYEKLGIPFPEIRFRKMVSRWGSCHAGKKLLTFNIHLMYAPAECVSYVVWHEFTHFLEQNHSGAFYKELEKVCPDWKMCRKRLREVVIP